MNNVYMMFVSCLSSFLNTDMDKLLFHEEEGNALQGRFRGQTQTAIALTVETVQTNKPQGKGHSLSVATKNG